MIDCALPERDSYSNRLRGLDRVARRLPDGVDVVKMAYLTLAVMRRAYRLITPPWDSEHFGN